MNILILTSVFPRNNMNHKKDESTKVVYYFAKEWKKAGHNVRVIHNAHRYPALVYMIPDKWKEKFQAKKGFQIPDINIIKQENYVYDGLSVSRLPILKLKPHGNHPQFVIDKQCKKIVAILKKEGFEPDVIVGHWMSPQAQIISKLKDVYHCRTALVLHGRGYVKDKKFDCRKYLDKIDAIGCRSRAEAEYVQNALSLPNKPFVCYSGVPDDFVSQYSFDEKKFQSVPDPWRFVYAGRLVEYKNVDKILCALAPIKENYTLDIIGAGDEEASLKQLAADLGIKDKVVFHGKVARDKVLEIMRQAHCFIMISRGEVFGLVYLEAMSSSCITIASKDGGIDGVINSWENGILCRAGDAEELSNTIQVLMKKNISELSAVSRAGFITATEYTDSKVAGMYLEDALKWMKE